MADGGKITKIRIDNRETIKNDFTINPELITYENLDLGDYIIESGGEPILVIERKTVNDWCSSIKDGRYHEQKDRLTSNFSKDNLLFIIEGDLKNGNFSEKYNKVIPDTLISSIFNTMYRDGLRVFHTTDSAETIFLIESLFKKVHKGGFEWGEKTSYMDTVVGSLKVKKKENITFEMVYLSMLCCIPGVSLGIAKQIQEYFPKWSDLIEKAKSYTDEEERNYWIENIIITTSTGKIRKLGVIGHNILKFIC
jgi:ERCC4-type nuclease